MRAGRALPRAVVAQVVHVDSVNNVLVAALAAHRFQAREQFVLAVEATVRSVARVVRIFKLVGCHVLVDDPEALHERLRIALVRFRQRGRVGGDGHGVCPQSAVRRPRQIGGVGAAAKGHNHAAHGREVRQQLALLLFNRAAKCQVN